MAAFFDAWWRAALHCLHPLVVLWALPPLALVACAVLGLGWWYWEPSVAGVRQALERWDLLGAVFEWLDSIGGARWRAVLAPLVLVTLAVPAIVVTSMLLVAWLAAPGIASFVVRRRFPGLDCDASAPGGWRSVGWSLLCTVAAVLALAVSVPLWFVPPLVLVLPPLVWGWLAWRVFAFAALARHAGDAERHELLWRHRWPLRTMALACGYAAMMPSLMWAGGAAALVLAPWLMMAAVALYTLVFTFESLWFTHYLLAALDERRRLAPRSAT